MLNPNLVLAPREACSPLTEGDELLFCASCNARAVQFLKASQYAVLMAGVDHSDNLQEKVKRSLSTFLHERERCPSCGRE